MKLLAITESGQPGLDLIILDLSNSPKRSLADLRDLVQAAPAVPIQCFTGTSLIGPTAKQFEVYGKGIDAQTAKAVLLRWLEQGDATPATDNPTTLLDSLNQLLADFGGKPCRSGETIEEALASVDVESIPESVLERALVGYDVIDPEGDVSKIDHIVSDEMGMGVGLENGLINGFDQVTIP